VKEYLFFKKRVNKRGSFSVKMVYKRVRAWTLGLSLPELCRVAPRVLRRAVRVPAHPSCAL